MSYKILFCVSVVTLLSTQGFADGGELPETITELCHAGFGMYTVHSSGTTTITDGSDYGGCVLVGAYYPVCGNNVVYKGGGPSVLSIATDDTLSINCDKDCSESLCYYVRPYWYGCRPNFFIAGDGGLDVGAGGTINLTKGQMIMAGGSNGEMSTSNISGKIDMTGGEWSITGLNTKVNVNSPAEIYLTGGTTTISDTAVMNLTGGTTTISDSAVMDLGNNSEITISDTAVVNLTGGTTRVWDSAKMNLSGGTMKITKGTLNIGNNTFCMSNFGILDLLDMTDFSKISGRINMSYDDESAFGIRIRYLPTYNNDKKSATLSGNGLVHVYPDYSNTIGIDKDTDTDTGIITYLGGVPKEPEKLGEYMEDLGFTVNDNIQFKWRDTATDWLKYVLTSATDDEGNFLNSSNYTIDLDSLFIGYNTKNITLPELRNVADELYDKINCKLKCSSGYSVSPSELSMVFDNDMSEFKGTLVGQFGCTTDITFNAEPMAGDIVDLTGIVTYAKADTTVIGTYNEVYGLGVSASAEVVLADGSSYIVDMDEPRKGGVIEPHPIFRYLR